MRWLVALLVLSIYTPGPPAALDLLVNRLSGDDVEFPRYDPRVNAATSIAVCCAWGGRLADGELTYRISGGDSLARQVIRDAVEAWDTALPGLALTEVAAGADIEIRFERSDERRGRARHQFDGRGFITGARLTIFGDAVTDTEAVRQVAQHEVGHALGAGHADGDGVLMSPTVSGGSARFGQCDLDAVVAANRWKLVDGRATSHTPSVPRVLCNGPGDGEGPPERWVLERTTRPSGVLLAPGWCPDPSGGGPSLLDRGPRDRWGTMALGSRATQPEAQAVSYGHPVQEEVSRWRCAPAGPSTARRSLPSTVRWPPSIP